MLLERTKITPHLSIGEDIRGSVQHQGKCKPFRDLLAPNVNSHFRCLATFPEKLPVYKGNTSLSLLFHKWSAFLCIVIILHVSYYPYFIIFPSSRSHAHNNSFLFKRDHMWIIFFFFFFFFFTPLLIAFREITCVLLGFPLKVKESK